MKKPRLKLMERVRRALGLGVERSHVADPGHHLADQHMEDESGRAGHRYLRP
jgi:hypothetical protein